MLCLSDFRLFYTTHGRFDTLKHCSTFSPVVLLRHYASVCYFFFFLAPLSCFVLYLLCSSFLYGPLNLLLYVALLCLDLIVFFFFSPHPRHRNFMVVLAFIPFILLKHCYLFPLSRCIIAARLIVSRETKVLVCSAPVLIFALLLTLPVADLLGLFMLPGAYILNGFYSSCWNFSFLIHCSQYSILLHFHPTHNRGCAPIWIFFLKSFPVLKYG